MKSEANILVEFAPFEHLEIGIRNASQESRRGLFQILVPLKEKYSFIKMHRTIVFTLFLVSVTLQSVLGSDALTDEERKLCLKVSRKTFKHLMKNFRACNDKLKIHLISGEEYQKKVGCVVRCVMENLEVLDGNGMMTSEKVKTAIGKFAPPETIDYVHERFSSKCLTAIKLDPTDENCKTYLDMGTCLQSSTAEMCGEEPAIL